MKTELVALNSKFVHTSLALRYISSYARERGLEVEIAEYTINNRPEKIVASLFEKKADVYGFSLYIFNRKETLSVIRDLKKVAEKAIIFCGGPEASEDGKRLLAEYPEIDFIIRGEGERADFEFLTLVEKCDKDIEKIKRNNPKNVSFFLDGEYVETQKLPLIENLDTIPFPYKKEELAELKNRILYYESSRGCPFSCSYCMSSLDKKVRTFSKERVFSDISAFIEAEVSIVKFVDRTFNFNKKRALDILSYIMLQDKGKTEFHFEISLWLVSREITKLLQNARKGLFRFEIGIQTANKKTLRAINREKDVFDFVDIFKELRKTNVHIHTDLIAGLPYEGYESFLTSLDKAYLLGGDVLQLGFLKILKGAPIESRKEFGIIAQSEPPYEIMKNKWISYEEIIRLKKAEEILEIFYNSGLTKTAFDYSVKNIFNESVSSLLLYLSSESDKTNFFDLPKKPRELFAFFSKEILSLCEKKDAEAFSDALTYDYFAADLYTGEENFLSASPDYETAKKLLDFPEETAEKLPANKKERFLSTEAKKWRRKIKVVFFKSKKNPLVFFHMPEPVIFEIDEKFLKKISKT